MEESKFVIEGGGGGGGGGRCRTGDAGRICEGSGGDENRLQCRGEGFAYQFWRGELTRSGAVKRKRELHQLWGWGLRVTLSFDPEVSILSAGLQYIRTIRDVETPVPVSVA